MIIVAKDTVRKMLEKKSNIAFISVDRYHEANSIKGSRKCILNELEIELFLQQKMHFE